MEKKTPQTHDVTAAPRPADAGCRTSPVGPAPSAGAPLDARWGSEGRNLSDPKNHYLRTLLLELHAPCAAQRGAERPGGSQESNQWHGWKKAPVGPAHLGHDAEPHPKPAGFCVHCSWCGDEDEDEDDYLQWISIAQEPQPDEGTIGLGRFVLPKPCWPTRQDLTGRGETGGEQVE